MYVPSAELQKTRGHMTTMTVKSTQAGKASTNLRMNSPQEVFEIITAIKNVAKKVSIKCGRKILATDILFACKRKVKATRVHDDRP